jgi:hypothetical protein
MTCSTVTVTMDRAATRKAYNRTTVASHIVSTAEKYGKYQERISGFWPQGSYNTIFRFLAVKKGGKMIK